MYPFKPIRRSPNGSEDGRCSTGLVALCAAPRLRGVTRHTFFCTWLLAEWPRHCSGQYRKARTQALPVSTTWSQVPSCG